MRYRKSLLVACISVISTTANALDFEQAYQKMLSNNGQFRAELQNLKAAGADAWQAKSRLLPNVYITGRYGLNEEYRETIRDSELNDVFESTNQKATPEDDALEPLALEGLRYRGDSVPVQDEYLTGDASINIEQALIDVEKIYQAKQLSSQKKEAYFRLLLLRESLILELVDAYTGFLSAQDLHQIAIKELAVLEKHRSLTTKRFDQGLGNSTDVQEAESRYQLVRAELLQSESDIVRYARELDVLIAETYSQLAHLTSSFNPADIAEPNFDEFDNIETNDTLLAAQKVKSAKYNLRATQSRFLPTLQIAGRSRYFEQENSLFGDENERITNSLMLELQMPLFAGFGKVAQAKSAKHRFKSEQELASYSKQQALADYQINQMSYEASYKRLQALKQAYQFSQSAQQLREKGYLEGLSSNLDLLDSVRDSFRSERQYRAAIYEYFRKYFRFHASYRELEIGDIEYFNQFLTKKTGEQESE